MRKRSLKINYFSILCQIGIIVSLPSFLMINIIYKKITKEENSTSNLNTKSQIGIRSIQRTNKPKALKTKMAKNKQHRELKKGKTKP